MNIKNVSRSSAFTRLKLLTCYGAAGLAVIASVQGAEYRGANSVLRLVEEQSAKKAEPSEKQDENARLRQDLADFRKRVGGMAAAEAAKGWLTLSDRGSTLSQTGTRRYDPASQPLTPEDFAAALPPPAAWPELAKAIGARPAGKGNQEVREIGLRLVAATLTGDSAARSREITALQAKAEKSDARAMYFYRSVLEQISEAMLQTLDDPEAVIRSLERRLMGGEERGTRQVRVPNLVALAGPEKAETFLRRALVQENVVLEVEDQNETSRLAQKLALELVGQLKQPQWGLVNSIDSVSLYEAMNKRFGEAKEKTPLQPVPGIPDLPDLSSLGNNGGDHQKLQAQTYYLLGLIAQNRAKDAVEVARKLGKQNEVYFPNEAMKALERAGYTQALDNFFYELLSQDAALPFWNDYVQIAAKAGETERMVKLARSTAARDDLTAGKKVVIHQTLYRALLAGEEVEEGVKEIRRLIALEDSTPRSRRAESAGELGLSLARLGMLLQKPEWTEEGIRVAQKSLEKTTPDESAGWGEQGLAPGLAGILLELNRGAEAEGILANALAKAVKDSQRSESYGWNEGLAPSLLTALAGLYSHADRHSDVLALFDQAPYWGAKDLLQLTGESYGYGGYSRAMRGHGSETISLYSILGKALLGTGRKAEAQKVVDAMLESEPGLDRGYELLLAIGGTTVLERLDQLFAQDQFEERPLIWKAEVLRRQNKLEEAEQVARRAISIDPSDGEQGRGDRMRVYAVLAEIREGRGDKKEAEFFRGVVKAIRLSEEADQYYAAGLLKRAVQMYEDSLKHFADAYCIQSRLAVQLAEMGLHEQAEAHYRRAYELMPDSFGRVESHCFGCERAFEGQRAQSLAEKIFTELAVKTPKKPQVHYLLGFLREEQGRHSAALPHFQTAVKLDPDYLNAWVKIAGISEQLRLPAKENDEVVFNILRLDPFQRHAHVSFQRVNDLAGLWNAMEAGQKKRPAMPESLYTLAASKAAVEKQESDPKSQQYQRGMFWRMREELREGSPAQAVAQNPFVRVGLQLSTGNSALMLEE